MKKISMKMYIIVALTSVLMLMQPILLVSGAETTVVVSVSFTNLANPGDEHYEGWLITDSAAIPGGKFTVDDQGNIKDLNGNSVSSFDIPNVDITKVTKYVLTLEPAGDSDTIPSDIKPLAGAFSNNEATISPNLGVSLSSISGGYILATPSDGADNNELAGIWYLDPNAGPGVSLNLPDLTNTDWVYEGWMIINGHVLSTGRFNKTNEADSFDGYSGDQGYPPFPGEDFIKNAPTGLTFPVDLSGAKAVISIEPKNDNSPDPFQFKPLVADIPSNAMASHYYTMDDNSGTLATGSVTISDKSNNASFNGGIEAIFFLVGISGVGLIFRKKHK